MNIFSKDSENFDNLKEWIVDDVISHLKDPKR